jgi:rubredoxin
MGGSGDEKDSEAPIVTGIGGGTKLAGWRAVRNGTAEVDRAQAEPRGVSGILRGLPACRRAIFTVCALFSYRHMSEVVEYQSWVCLICGWIYNEQEGLPDEGIPAGTRFADIPTDWRCPLCDVGKEDFVVVDF